MNHRWLDMGIIIIYLILVLLVGIYFFRKNQSADNFTGKTLAIPAWALGLSVFATYISSISFLALPGSAFTGNWSGFVFSLSIPFAAYLAVKYFVPVFRKLESESAYTYLEERFGTWARKYAAICYLLTQVARMGAILYLLALPVHLLTHWSIYFIIGLVGILVLIYSAIGGLAAVVYTDAVQSVILIAGAVFSLIYLITSSDLDLNQLLSTARAQEKLSLGSWQFSWQHSSIWLIFFYGLFINIQNFGADQNYIQRYKTAQTDKDANYTIWMGALIYVPVSLLFFAIGTFLWLFYKTPGHLLPVDIAADQVFPYFILNELPTGLSGFLIAAILAAGMSTISTGINSSSTVILAEIKSQRKISNELAFLRICSVILGSISMAIAFTFLGIKNALDVWWALASIFSGGVAGLFVLGIFSNTKAMLQVKLSMLLAVIFIVYITLSQQYPSAWWSMPLHPNFLIIISTLLLLLPILFYSKKKG